MLSPRLKLGFLSVGSEMLIPLSPELLMIETTYFFKINYSNKVVVYVRSRSLHGATSNPGQPKAHRSRQLKIVYVLVFLYMRYRV